MPKSTLPETPIPATQRISSPGATRAANDGQLVRSWLDSFASPHSRRNGKRTADRFLEELVRIGLTLRTAAVEDVRTALSGITSGVSDASARQYVLRIKSLLTYAHKLGYTPFNAGVVITVKGANPTARAGSIAKRIIGETAVAILIRSAPSKRDRLLLQVAYAAGLRVSELVALRWADVIERGDGRVQLHVIGKGQRERQVLLPDPVAKSLQSLRTAASSDAPVFPARHGGHLSERAVNAMIKRTARKADIPDNVSAHWLRHAHGSHALDRGATLAEVQATLGHSNIATTSAYLHARPDSSSGLKLDPGVFLR
jgi:site-specific recombinase XerD